MGYIRHHAIVVTTWDETRLDKAYRKAKKIFGTDVTSIIEAATNGYKTFFIGPDGSKEGWQDSNLGNDRREQFIEFLNTQREDDGSSCLDWAVIQYGDEEGINVVLEHEAIRRY